MANNKTRETNKALCAYLKVSLRELLSNNKEVLRWLRRKMRRGDFS